MPPHNDVAGFHSLLRTITAPGNPRPPRIMALCGAGLSAASGLATFRGSTAALWHTHDPMTLATPAAFRADPRLVWRFYAHRRHAALAAQPNAAHRALAALATALGDDPGATVLGNGPDATVLGDNSGATAQPRFLCLTQNVDGLSQRAGHPLSSLRTLHGSLFDLRCADAGCNYRRENMFGDLPDLPDLPPCPACNNGALLRPGVVWFGEGLDAHMLQGIDDWIRRDTVDLLLVVGTSAQVAPAAGYIDDARDAGAVVATIDLDTAPPAHMQDGDFVFAGSAADLLPRLLAPVIATP